MNLKVLLLMIFIFIGTTISAKDKRARIKDYTNKQIIVKDNFAGQSITLIKDKGDYYILRKYFGSGIPIVGTAKYKVIFNSDYQIIFYEIVGTPVASKLNNKIEEFLLCVDEKGLSLYVNQLKVEIEKTKSSNDE